MTRFLVLFLIVISLSGCHSVPSEPGKTVLAETRFRGTTSDILLSKAVGLFQPVPDGSKTPSSPYTPVAHQPGIVEPKAPEKAVDITRKPASTQLYRPGSIFPAPILLDAPESTPAPVAATPKTPTKTEKSDILLPREDDSERFRQLLTLIRETPRKERGVDDAELARLLENFRNAMQEESVAELGLESDYLVRLRKKILPSYSPVKKAPVPMAETDAEDEDEHEERAARPVRQRTERPAKAPRRYRQEYEEDDEEEELQDREALALKSRKKTRTPSPPAAIPQETAQSAPAPLPPGPPVYPGLTQLDGTTPAPLPQAASLTATYANQHGIVPVHYVAPGTMPQAQGTWEHHSQLAAQLLRQQMDSTVSSRSFSNEARLRLLELVNGNRNEAVKPFTQVEKPFNDFWGNQILGFSALMDDLGHPDTRSRYGNAAFRIDEGLMDLRKLCPIRLKNVRLARDVWAFGDYLARSPECQSGEKIDVYFELENPTVRRTGDGFNVGISISYEIRDNSGSVIKKYEEPPIQSTTPSQRRDYFIHLKVEVPKNLTPGSYHLRVNVTDLNDESMLFAEEQISLTVLPSDPEKRAGNHAYHEPR